MSTGADQSWLRAEQYVASMGPTSPLYSAAIRAIRNAPSILKTDRREIIAEFAVESALRGVRISPTFSAAFYAAAQDLDLDLTKATPLSARNLLRLFTPDEIAAVIGLTFLYRVLRKGADFDEWERLMPKVAMHMQIGAIVGDRTPLVGRGYGMFIGGVRVLAQALFLWHDLKGFKEVRRKADGAGFLFSIEDEEKRWGCNHLQIASGLASNLGFGLGARMGIGMEAHPAFFEQQRQVIKEVEAEVKAWQSCTRLSLALHERRDIQSLRHELVNDAAAEVEFAVKNALEVGKGFTWLERSVDEFPQIAIDALKLKRGTKPSDEDSPKKEATW